ncbi:alpha/beta hydrolase [Kribbella pittospori]|uniref:Alpha/beta hydrolase n=1 Tax=Kribbella pittospori TaxID=722689 RepID=A0A4R0KQ36_9ACTN|nr:alpha/beta hydrolase [Kribbella pittospori]TCC61086.1 alpha/beta hydrolase [Kribbella pittospori]
MRNFVEVPDGYLYYEQHGQGADVVLLNGGLADVRMWDSTVAWLSESARVTTWDYRDNGLSSASYAAYSEIDDLAAVMDAAGVERAVLIGSSDGARRALGFAHRYPDRVRRVCAVAGSFGEFPDASPAEAAARVVMRAHFTRLEEILAADGIPAAAAYDVAGWCPVVNEADRRLLIGLAIANSRVLTMPVHHGEELDPPIKTRFAELKPPLSVLVGGRDFQGTQLWAARLATQAPTAGLKVIPDADHMPMFSAPDEFRRFVTEALIA